MKRFYVFIVAILLFGSFSNKNEPKYVIRKGNVRYDFSFPHLAINYLEKKDSAYLVKIAELNTIDHILNHAKKFNYNVPKSSGIELASFLLSPPGEKAKLLEAYKKNLQYAKDSIAGTDLAQKTCLKYLPKGFTYASSLFFTFGYDLGVVYGKNASLNLAHPHYISNHKEIKYYSIHELHHAGFVTLKNEVMPDLDIKTYREMAELIEYYTHLEGMGTYAPLELRQNDKAMNTDADYIALQDTALMLLYEQEYFEIYFHFKDNPDNVLTDADWEKISALSNGKRLWYRIGAKMAGDIDKKLGRNKLTSLIPGNSENFFNEYFAIKGQ